MIDTQLAEHTSKLKRRYSSDYEKNENEMRVGENFHVCQGDVAFHLMFDKAANWYRTLITVDDTNVALVIDERPTEWIKDSPALRSAINSALSTLNTKRWAEESNQRELRAIADSAVSEKEKSFNEKWGIE